MINTKKLWLLALLLLFFDQFTKMIAELKLPYSEEIHFGLSSWMSFVKYYNESTFMLVHNAQVYDVSLFHFQAIYAAIAFVLIYGIWWVSRHPLMKDNLIEVKFALIGLFVTLGGVMGNLTDRMIKGKVVDFLKLNFFTEYEPVINAADIMLYVGLLLILCSWAIIITKCFKNCFLKKK